MRARLKTLLVTRREPAPEAAVVDDLLSRWRAARLAHVSSALGRFGHDLRGILSPALMTAERLQRHPDPAVKRAGDTMMRAVERATEALRDTLGAVRDGMPCAPRVPTRLREIIDATRPHGLALDADLTDEVTALVDPIHVAAGFRSLFAHLCGSGASRATVSAIPHGRAWTITVAFDGQPLSLSEPAGTAADRQELSDFVIARQWFRACGAELLELGGFRIAMTLPTS